MSGLHTPREVLHEIAAAIPEELRKHVVIIGSLAAGFASFGDEETLAVRTKDVDCVLVPFSEAVDAATNIAQQLYDAGWKRSPDGDHTTPGTEATPDDQLPAIRLFPPHSEPGTNSWFLELLTEPASEEATGKTWTRVVLSQGHFGLPSFRFLRLLTRDPLRSGSLQIAYARPELMALANLLEHPTIKPDTVSNVLDASGLPLRRSNKDLGRALALGFLAQRRNADFTFREWNASWAETLKGAFPKSWRDHAAGCGGGIRALLAQRSDLDQAVHSASTGLLVGMRLERGEFDLVARRMLAEAIEPLERQAREEV